VPALSPRASRVLACTLLAAGVDYFLLAGTLRQILRPYGYASDFATFYSAAQAFTTGEDPYARERLASELAPEFSGWVGRYFYPPPFAAVALRPLVALPFAEARRLWVVLESAAYLGAGFLLVKILFGVASAWPFVAAGVVLLYFTPMRVDLKLGSVSGLLLLLFALFLFARSRRAEVAAACALAAMIVLKLAPAVLLFHAACRGQFRLLRLSVLACLLLLVAALPWTGWRAYETYATSVLPQLLTQRFAWFTNQSLDAFFTRLFLPNPDSTPWLDAPALATTLIVTTSLAVLVTLALLARHEAQSADDSAWGPALALLASLLLARVTWESMVVLSLPCFLLCLRACWMLEVSPPLLVTWGVAWALCALPFPYVDPPHRSGAGLLLESPRLYGILLLFATSAHWRLRRRRT
jgi:glycosyl transferase family 87